MKTSFLFRWAPVLIALPLLFGVLVGIYQQGIADLKNRPEQARQIGQSVVDKTSDRLGLMFRELERATRLFAQANQTTLEQLLLDPENSFYMDRLKKALQEYFPDAYSATLATPLGEPIMELEPGLCGELCRMDISDFASRGQQREVFLHPVAGSPHITLMTSIWLRGRELVFFLSFSPEFVSRELLRHQPENHELILAREDKPGLVEITALGDRTQGLRDNFISPREKQRILAQKKVPGTRWILIDLPNARLLQSFRFQWGNPHVLIFVSVLILGLILIVYLQFVHLKGRRYASLLEDNNRELAQASLHDSLTGLPNRRLFVERLEQAINEAGRDGRRLAVMLIGLNHFKQINDSLGHRVGDYLLQIVGKRVRSLLREVDTVARLGSDEFVVLLKVDSTEQTHLVAATTISAIARQVNVGKAELNIDASLGIALYPDHGQSPDKLMTCADQAMCEAKEKGERTGFFEEREKDQFPDRLQLMAGLADAIRDEQLRLWYQPKLSLAGESPLCRVESLVRWQHPQRGLLFPDEFLPLAERANAVRPLTEWVVRQAIGLIGRFTDHKIQLQVAVNLSVRVLEDKDFIHWFKQTVSEAGLDPALIVCEITESAEIVDSILCKKMLESLHQFGFKLSIDDFGAGYSSLAMLRQLSVSELKIDRGFISDLPDNAENRKIVAATIHLAHELDFNVVAEGVEDDATARILQDMGCDLLQGYAVEKPMPESSLLLWCENRENQALNHA